MSVAGYNVDPEFDESVVLVELAEDGKSAQLSIGEGYEETCIKLSYDELYELMHDMKMVHEEIKWNMTAFLFASDGSYRKSHLIHKGNAPRSAYDEMVREAALCGSKAPPQDWSLLPVIGNEPNENCCKRCLALYRKMK